MLGSRFVEMLSRSRGSSFFLGRQNFAKLKPRWRVVTCLVSSVASSTNHHHDPGHRSPMNKYMSFVDHYELLHYAAMKFHMKKMGEKQSRGSYFQQHTNLGEPFN